jgi:enterochelin esterase-like enzyme
MRTDSLVEDFVRSRWKSPGRRIWTLRPRLSPARLLVLLDGELYLEGVMAAQVVRELEDASRIPPTLSIFVSNNGPASRHADYVCDEDYARFLADELLPSVFAREPGISSDHVGLAGLSLSGLAAAHAALITGRFRVAVCQSPSFWWNQEQLVSALPEPNGSPTAFWVSVGDLETDCGISHPPSGLFQSRSQRDSCTRVAAALQAAGYPVSQRIFRGGHDPEHWREDLGLALPWAANV